MITKVFDYQRSPDAVQTNFNSTKKESPRILSKTVKDKVRLSTDGLQKAGETHLHAQKARELLEPRKLIDPLQKENIEKLIADLKAIQDKSELTDSQRETLKNDLISTLQGVQKPSQTAVENLAADFSEIISDDHIDLNEIKVLQEDVNLVLNSANISDEKIEVLKEDFQAIVESSNISEEDLETLWNDIVQILETARKASNP